MHFQPKAPEHETGSASLSWRWYSVIFTGAVLLRLACLSSFISSPYFAPIGGDRALYHDLAVSIFNNRWFPDVLSCLPLYPTLLGLLYKTLGAPNLAAAAILQSFCEGLTAMLIAIITLRHYGRRAAVLAGAGYALLGAAAAYALVTMPVSLALLWTAAVASIADAWKNNWTLCRAAAKGLLLGCGGQLIGSFWLMIIPFAVWAGISAPRANLRLKFLTGFLVISGAVATVAPSLIHNYMIEKQITPMSAHFGLNLFMGNNPSSTGYGSAIPGLRTSAGEMTADAIALASQITGKQMSASKANRFWTRQAARFWRDRPAKAFGLVLNKIHRAVSLRDFDDTGICRLFPEEIPALRIAFINFGLVWICACSWLLLSPGGSSGKAVFWIMGICNFCGLLVTFVTARYRLPLAIMLLPSAAGAIAVLPRYFSDIAAGRHFNIRWKRMAVGLAGILVAALPHSMPDTATPDDINRSIYLCQAGRLDEATYHAQRACAQQPGSADAWLAAGNARMLQGNFEAAFKCYETALAIQGGRPDILFNAGLALEKSNRKQDACGYYERAVALDPSHAKAWLGLALIYREAGNRPAAHQAIERAAAIAGRNHAAIIEYFRAE